MNELQPSVNHLRQPDEFVRLLVDHQFQLYSFILSLVPNCADADDVMQETSVALWEMFEQFQPGSDFAAWASQVARFRVKQFRKMKPHAVLVDDDVLDRVAETSMARSDESEVRRRALNDCVRRLPARDHELLQQTFDPATRTMKQVADALGRPINTVYKAVSRIHQALADCVQRVLRAQEHR
jgi:RNA polymerase sigma-70 factor (ECF subfamily)